MRRRLNKRRYKSLRARLTWSYVWVTVVITMVLNIAVFAVISFYNPRLSAGTLLNMTQRYASDLAPLLDSTDPATLQTVLRYKFGTRIPGESESAQSLAVSAGTNLSIGDSQAMGYLKVLPDTVFSVAPTEPFSESAALVVLDSQGRVLAGTFPNVFLAGQPLSDPLAPGSAGVVGAALRNETANLTLSLEHSTVAAAPILAADGQVRGVLYVRSDPSVTDRSILIMEVAVVLVVTVVTTLLLNALIGLVFGWFTSRNPVQRLKTLASATHAVAGGDLSPRIQDESPDEIGQLGRQFNAMADQLEQNIRALRQLADDNAALAEQATQLATIEERNRLARDLHDSVSQELFSVTMLAAAARNLLTTNPEKAQIQLHQLSQMAQRALHETRALIFALRPAALGNQGLAPALRQLRDEASGRLDLQIDLQVSGERRIPLDQEQALFRITQEALANVAKHSGTHAAVVQLEYAATQTCIKVRDQGRGFNPDEPRKPHSLGLISIGERAAAVGGSCQVTSLPDQGTTVQVCVPNKPGFDG
jgi:signal transduction histidine kinase